MDGSSVIRSVLCLLPVGFIFWLQSGTQRPAFKYSKPHLTLKNPDVDDVASQCQVYVIESSMPPNMDHKIR